MCQKLHGLLGVRSGSEQYIWDKLPNKEIAHQMVLSTGVRPTLAARGESGCSNFTNISRRIGGNYLGFQRETKSYSPDSEPQDLEEDNEPIERPESVDEALRRVRMGIKGMNLNPRKWF